MVQGYLEIAQVVGANAVADLYLELDVAGRAMDWNAIDGLHPQLSPLANGVKAFIAALRDADSGRCRADDRRGAGPGYGHHTSGITVFRRGFAIFTCMNFFMRSLLRNVDRMIERVRVTAVLYRDASFSHKKSFQSLVSLLKR
jgi:hypothetical protein